MAVPIFCDSRGEGLAQSIFETTGNSECVFTFNGATIESLTDEICEFLKYSDPTHIYFSAGVNNLTQLIKLGYRKICVSIFTDEAVLINTVMSKLKAAIKRIVLKKPSVKVILVPIVGLSIADYNNKKRNGPRQPNDKTPARHYDPDPYQHIINNALQDLNKQILELNVEGGVETPLVHRYVHKDPGHGRPVRHAYSKLVDGLHPRPDTLKQWGRAYNTAIRANSNRLE